MTEFNQNANLLMAKRRNPATFAARHDPFLPPWAVKYALWLVQSAPVAGPLRSRPRDGFGASETERRMKLQSLTHADWNTHAVKALHRRADFQELLGKLTSINADAVRQALVANGYRYVEVLEESVEELRKGEDWKTAGELSLKAINQILPKGPDVVVAQQYNISISEKRLAALDEPEVVTEASPIVP